MKCPVCNEELKIMFEYLVENNIFEIIGMCESCLYDGKWLVEKDETGNVLKEYDLRRYWHG